MVTMTIKLYKDSAGALLAEFLNGINSVSQNNSNVNEVLVVLDNFELAVGEVLRIGYELSTGEEVEDYTLMKDNFDGTYSAEIPYAVANGETDSEWKLGLQVASNWVENKSYTGYRNKQNLVTPLLFTVNNAVKDRNGKYPKLGDIQTLYNQAVAKTESEEKNAEKIEKLKNEKGQPNGIATLDENGKVPAEQLPDIMVGGGEFEIIPVAELPAENINFHALYLLKTGTDGEENIYTEYLYVNGKWEPIGTMSVAVDLTDYVKRTDIASGEKAGVVKINDALGIRIDSKGALYLDTASDSEIANQKGNAAIKVDQTPQAVKSGLLKHDNVEWTDEDKAKACETIGAQSRLTADDNITIDENNKISVNLPTETWTFTLEDGTTLTKTVLVK